MKRASHSATGKIHEREKSSRAKEAFIVLYDGVIRSYTNRTNSGMTCNAEAIERL